MIMNSLVPDQAYQPLDAAYCLSLDRAGLNNPRSAVEDPDEDGVGLDSARVFDRRSPNPPVSIFANSLYPLKRLRRLRTLRRLRVLLSLIAPVSVTPEAQSKILPQVLSPQCEGVSAEWGWTARGFLTEGLPTLPYPSSQDPLYV